MEHPGFFKNVGPFTLGDLLNDAEAKAVVDNDLDRQIADIKPLDIAGPTDLSFFDNRKYLKQFEETKAVACFVKAEFANRTPKDTFALISDDPYRSFALALRKFYPDAMQPAKLL